MEKTENNGVACIIKGVMTAIIVTLISVLVLAAVVKFSFLAPKTVKIINQFIKVISIFLGCIFFVRESKGLIKGGAVGILTTLLTYLIFALIGSNPTFGVPFIIDLIFGLIVGGISGAISVNLRK